MLRVPVARLVPWAVLALSLFTTGLLDVSIGKATKRRQRNEYAAEVGRLTHAVDDAVKRQVSVLESTAGAVAADRNLDQRSFAVFYDHLAKGKDAQIPVAIGLSLWRPWERRGELEAEAVRRGAKRYRLRPPDPRPEAHAVVLLMPLDKQNQIAPGFDMHAEPIRRAAMDAARASNRAVMTRMVYLAHDTEVRKPAFILYLPVFDPVDHSLTGFVYSGMRAGSLFGDLFDTPDAHVGLKLWSGDRKAEDLVLDHSPGEEPLHREPFRIGLPAGGTLEAEATFSSKFGTPPVIRPYVVPVGTTVSLLLFLLATVLRRAHESSERREAEQALLAEVGRLTAGEADSDEILREIAVATARTLDAVCRIDLLEEGGALRTVSTRTEGREELAALERDYPRLEHDSLLRAALETGKSQQSEGYPAVDEGHRARIEALNAGPVLLVPLRLGERSLGAFSIVRPKGAAAFSPEAVALTEAIAGRLALAIDNERLYRDLERRVEERTRDLEASNHELESFCYSVSHDLRTPLRSLDGFGRALREDYGDRLDEQGLDYIERIRASTKRMDELITALLTLSRLTRREIVPVDVDVTAMVCDQMHDLDPEGKIGLKVQDGLVLHADPRMLAVVFDNLLTNAIKFSSRSEGPEIVVGENDAGELFVRDNGAGFDMAYANKLFQPFERLHSVCEFPGHGIGLATVERIVRRHGGSVRAEGRPGEGATFFLTFPD